MQLELDCLPCIFRQVLEAGRMASNDRGIIKEIINKYAEMIPGIEMNESAPEIVGKIQDVIKKMTGEKDPYLKFKEKNIKTALELYNEAEKFVVEHDNPLLASLFMSAMGNSIDAGVSLDVDIQGNIKKVTEDGFKQNDLGILLDKITGSADVLIIADNTGEAVFDRLLIKTLKKHGVNIIYAVRDQPILNDVTLEEAKKIGIDNLCNLISSGCSTPGVILDRASKEFLDIFNKADIVISKGQGNLEGLLGVNRGVFFLLKIKCQIVAKRLSSELTTGDFIFKYL